MDELGEHDASTSDWREGLTFTRDDGSCWRIIGGAYEAMWTVEPVVA